MSTSLLTRATLLRSSLPTTPITHHLSSTHRTTPHTTRINTTTCQRHLATQATTPAKTECYVWGTSSRQAHPDLSKTLLRPTHVNSPNTSGIRQIVFSTQHTVILTNDGQVYIYGKYDTEPAGTIMSLFSSSSKPTDITLEHISSAHDIVQIGAGVAHTVLLDKDGKVYTSGYGGSMLKGGALGHGNSKTVHDPQLVQSLADTRIQHISSGFYHNMALSNDHKLYAWGRGEYGRLGTGDSSDLSTPVILEALQHANVTQIKCGSSFNIALTDDGAVYTCGRNDKGQLGLGAGLILDTYSMESVPTQVEFDDDIEITAVDVGYRHCIVVDSDNRVWRWGQSQYLQPTLVKGDDSKFLKNRIVQVAAGKNFSAAVDEHGHLFTWGDGATCCLGHGDKTTVSQPRLVPGFGPKGEFGRVVSVFASNTHMGVHTARS